MPDTKFDDFSDALTTTLSNLEDSDIGRRHVDESLIPADGISFYIMRLSRAIIVHPDGNFFIGRSDEKNLWKPLVNLAELEGFAMGVSRRHAMIRPVDHGYEITDLFSGNGTWMDGRRILPNKSYLMPSGAELRIGRERLQVNYHSV